MLETSLIPAAQYLRMSTDQQKLSFAYQAATIGRYAGKHGFVVSKTYEDSGKSGLTLKRRQGLTQLLHDVVKLSASAAGKSLIRSIVRSVVVHPDRIKVEVSKQKLRGLLKGNLHASSKLPDPMKQTSDGVICLGIEARVKRCGGETRLVLPPDSPGQSRQPVSSLLKAMTRGRQWYEWILAGRVSSQRAIAQKLGLSERYAGRVLECAFLAPDIVESILAGR
jgi:hypothetical protein